MKPSEVILWLTVVLGAIWLFDRLVFRKKRDFELDLDKAKGLSWAYLKLVEGAHAFFPVLFLVLFLRSFVGEAFRIPSASMHPTLVEGDFIVVNKFCYGLRLPLLRTQVWSLGKPQAGDVVVFSRGDKDLIKRVVAGPGDKVRYQNKVLWVNDQIMTQVFQADILGDPKDPDWSLRRYTEHLAGKTHDILIRPARPSEHHHYPYQDVTVPAGHYFVMGDNRDNSDDSRFWGFVPEEQILGKAFGIFLSINWDQHQLRWQRFFSGIQ